jgi:hypothetical protein
MPDLLVISEVLSDNFDLVIALAKSWTRAQKRGKSQSWNLERERAIVEASGESADDGVSGSIEVAMKRLRSIRTTGPDL